MSELLERWLKAYQEWLAQRGYASATCQSYRERLGAWAEWVGQQEGLVGLADLTPQVLSRYLQWLCVRPHRPRPGAPAPSPRTALTARSRNGALQALRGFFRFLVSRRVLLCDPCQELEPARLPHTLPRSILTVSEVYRLLEALPTDTPLGWRNRAAVELLYATAMRRAELLGLRLADLRLREELVRVRGKGNRERVLPMGSEAARVLRVYLESARPHFPGAATQTALFLSATRGTPLNERALRRAIAGAARQAGLKKRVSFHTFRHSCATHLLARRADIRHIQALLGHAQLSTTQLYTRVGVQDLRQMVLRCHPREHLGE